MTETSNSPLPIGSLYFTNAPDFDPQVFFTDPSNTLYYMVFDVKNNHKLIYNGKLNGYNNNYRINLGKYIKFETQNDLDFEMIDNAVGRQTRSYSSGPHILLVFDATNLLVTQPSKFIYNSDGSIYCNGNPYTQFNESSLRNYVFEQKEDSDYVTLGTPSVVYSDSYVPFTNFKFSSLTLTVNILDSTNTVIDTLQVFNETNTQDTLIYIPSIASKIFIWSDIFNSKSYTVAPKPCNTKQWFYYSNNGILSTFWSTANIHNVDSTEREYITIGNRQLLTKSATTKQKKINIGFGLTEGEMYEIAKTPYVYEPTITDDGSLKLKRYKNNTTTFEGYNGTNLSERNIELVIEDEKKYKKITTPSIGFFD